MAQPARVTEGMRSTVDIMGHPVHPILIPFPVALLVLAGAVLLTITGWTGGELSYRHQIGVVGH